MAKALVKDYMTRSVTAIPPELTVREAVERVVNEGHVGLPVAEGTILLGFVTPKELLRNLHRGDAKIRDIIAKGTPVAHPDMDLDDCARVLFRMGIKELPVVNDDGDMVGIISTTDIIRSHIERVTPTKMEKLKQTLEGLYGIHVTVARKPVPITDLLPTQKRIYADELEGRKREIKRGLAEPIVVIWKKPKPVLVDGHHRVVAARRLGLTELEGYVMELDRDLELGLERTARSSGLQSLDDIEVNATAQHPLVEITTMLIRREQDRDKRAP